MLPRIDAQLAATAVDRAAEATGDRVLVFAGDRLA